MARTIAQIQQEILDRKALEPALSSLTNPSQYAIWRMWVYLIATIIYVHEQLWDVQRVALEAQIAAQKPGTRSWYADQVLAWQFGYSVQLVDGVPGYSVDDPAAQLAKRVSVQEGSSPGTISIKVAKEVSGSPAPLDAPEKASLEAYLDEVKFAGRAITVTSVAADEANVVLTYYYDAQLDAAAVQTAVIAAINAYFTGIDFGGVYFKMRLIDAVQAVPGVVDVDSDAATITFTDHLSVVTNDPRRYVMTAGYAVMSANTILQQPA